MCFSLRLNEMNVLYISSDCRGVTQSSLLHIRRRPVDGAIALLEICMVALRRSVTFPNRSHSWEQLGVKSSILSIRPRETSFLHKNRRKKLNEHVLSIQINLFQKFKVENNFDLDEMDESFFFKKRKKIIYT